jgi:hypothetical protein
MMKNTIRVVLLLSLFSLGACKGAFRCASSGVGTPAASAP